MKNKLHKNLKNLKMVAFDFDGVFTDGKVIFRQDGMESVICSRKDSLGTNMLQKHGIYLCVISKETNEVVAKRCKKMNNIDCQQAIKTGEGKKEILERIVKEKGFLKDEIAFMGDDVNDIPAMRFANVSFTVADGHSKAKEVADYTTKRNGGDHAVREICELILEAKGIKSEI